eukprot:4765069-Pyramimonas_sp.AAC.1
MWLSRAKRLNQQPSESFETVLPHGGYSLELPSATPATLRWSGSVQKMMARGAETCEPFLILPQLARDASAVAPLLGSPSATHAFP